MQNTDGESRSLRVLSQGRFFWNKRTGDDLRKSIEYLKQAIAKTRYALAYAALADSYGLLVFTAGSQRISGAQKLRRRKRWTGRFVS